MIKLPPNFILENPPILYKFRENTPITIESLIRSTIYIPKVKTFNDPQDSKIPFRYRKEEMTDINLYKKALELAQKDTKLKTTELKHKFIHDALEQKLYLDPDNQDWVDNQQYERINNDFGVFCLTPNFEIFLMWSYYSNSHSGIAIGYDYSLLVMTDLFFMISPVNYVTEFPEFSMYPQKGEFFLNHLYKKAKYWEHEQEYRLIHKYKNGPIHALPKEVIKEVIFGCNFEDKEELILTNKLLSIYPPH